jgi:hypothetical protein
MTKVHPKYVPWGSIQEWGSIEADTEICKLIEWQAVKNSTIFYKKTFLLSRRFVDRNPNLQHSVEYYTIH